MYFWIPELVCIRMLCANFGLWTIVADRSRIIIYNWDYRLLFFVHGYKHAGSVILDYYGK